MNSNQREKHKVLAANMWSIWNFGDPNDRYQRFLSRGRVEFRNFIENSLLYDEVYVPTQDFLSLTILLGVLGEDAIQELIATGTLKFIRIKGGMSYVGNGGGIQTTIIQSQDDTKQPYAFFSEIDYAVNWAINGLNIKPKDNKLYQKIIDNSIEVKIGDLTDKIKNETYNDIVSSKELQSFFSLRNMDLNNLKGINKNAVRVYGGKDTSTWTGDEIDTYLLLANTNLELNLMETVGCLDMTTSNPVGHMLRAKFNREIGKTKNTDSLTALKEIAGIPDFGEALLNKQINYSDLLRIKTTKNGAEFRDWFHKHCNGDDKKVAKEFIKILQDSPKMGSLPLKILRFIISSGLGFIPVVGSAIGTGAGLIDTFFLDKWTRGYSPKFFIEDLKQLEK